MHETDVILNLVFIILLPFLQIVNVDRLILIYNLQTFLINIAPIFTKPIILDIIFLFLVHKVK